MAMQTERTLPEVLQGIAGNLEEIIRAEFQLARTEVKEEASKARKPAVLMGAGFVVILYAFGLILLAIVYALSNVIAPWMAAFIVGAVLGVFGIAFVSAGKNKMKQVNAVPKRTAETLKENVEWAKQQIK
jgi:uncharacterized membrane protein YqjE